MLPIIWGIFLKKLYNVEWTTENWEYLMMRKIVSDVNVIDLSKMDISTLSNIDYITKVIQFKKKN